MVLKVIHFWIKNITLNVKQWAKIWPLWPKCNVQMNDCNLTIFFIFLLTFCLFTGLGCLAQVLHQNNVFSRSLTHLDLSDNVGCLSTEDAMVSEWMSKWVMKQHLNSEFTCHDLYISSCWLLNSMQFFLYYKYPWAALPGWPP